MRDWSAGAGRCGRARKVAHSQDSRRFWGRTWDSWKTMLQWEEHWRGVGKGWICPCSDLGLCVSVCKAGEIVMPGQAFHPTPPRLLPGILRTCVTFVPWLPISSSSIPLSLFPSCALARSSCSLSGLQPRHDFLLEACPAPSSGSHSCP